MKEKTELEKGQNKGRETEKQKNSRNEFMDKEEEII
jgi:hypothetical protein